MEQEFDAALASAIDDMVSTGSLSDPVITTVSSRDAISNDTDERKSLVQRAVYGMIDTYSLKEEIEPLTSWKVPAPTMMYEIDGAMAYDGAEDANGR